MKHRDESSESRPLCEAARGIDTQEAQQKEAALECILNCCIAEKVFSRGLKRESPSRRRGLKKERVMMRSVIILVMLLVINLPAY